MVEKRLRAPVRIDFGGGSTDIEPFTHTYGGAVLNAAINRYVTGKIIKTGEKVHLEYTGNAPTSSGLGTSGAMNLVWLALISQIKLKKKGSIDFKSKIQLAEKVYSLEQAMGLIGGKQDQYAAAFGGINFLKFKKDKVKIVQLKLDRKFIKEFENKLVLVYTGRPHFSGTSNKLIMDNLRKKKNVENLLKIKKVAIEMKNALVKKQLDRFADLMNQETQERKKLHKTIVSSKLESYIKKGFNQGAIGAKICGAGGGGSILFFTHNRKKLIKIFKDKVIDFKFDFEGLSWL